MDYARAKELIEAAGFVVDPEVPGQLHVNIRRIEAAPHFSIMLPNLPLPEAIPARAAVEAKKATLDSPAQQARPAEPGVSSEELHRKAETDALAAAIAEAHKFLPLLA